MSLSEFTSKKHEEAWSRFNDFLYYDQDLSFWLDISRMDVDLNDLVLYESSFNKAFNSMQELENGSIANKDESRQVGHYWLRTPTLAPSEEISNSINYEIQKIKEFGQQITSGNIKSKANKPFTDVLWIGIGGSALGPFLIVEGLRKIGKGLNFHFLDNIDSHGISDKFKELGNNVETTLIVIVSKSGGTPEPLICMEQVRDKIDNLSLDWSSQSVAITMKDSKLFKLAESESWLKIFNLPDWVGGRTSITSSVGLLPASFIQADIESFINGASIMDSITRITNIKDNPAALLALSWFKSGKEKGLRDMVVLPYKDRLQVFSRYLQQLVMESLGKRLDRDGNLVHQGIAVYGNKGSTDQHAYVQQLRDGIDNFFVTFIEILEDADDINIVNDKNPGDYLSGFLQGTREALTEAGRQNLTITFQKFNAKSLGALIALFERAVGLYAELININAYDQPGVEAGKKAAANILSLQEKIILALQTKHRLTIKQIHQSIESGSEESIFLIVRHLIYNNKSYTFSGELSKPDSLTIFFKEV